MRPLDVVGVDALFLRPGGERQVEAEHVLHPLVQALDVPVLGVGLGRHVALHDVVDGVVAHLHGDVGQVRPPP